MPKKKKRFSKKWPLKCPFLLSQRLRTGWRRRVLIFCTVSEAARKVSRRCAVRVPRKAALLSEITLFLPVLDSHTPADHMCGGWSCVLFHQTRALCYLSLLAFITSKSLAQEGISLCYGLVLRHHHSSQPILALLWRTFWRIQISSSRWNTPTPPTVSDNHDDGQNITIKARCQHAGCERR